MGRLQIVRKLTLETGGNLFWAIFSANFWLLDGLAAFSASVNDAKFYTFLAYVAGMRSDRIKRVLKCADRV